MTDATTSPDHGPPHPAVDYGYGRLYRVFGGWLWLRRIRRLCASNQLEHLHIPIRQVSSRRQFRLPMRVLLHVRFRRYDGPGDAAQPESLAFTFTSMATVGENIVALCNFLGVTPPSSGQIATAIDAPRPPKPLKAEKAPPHGLRKTWEASIRRLKPSLRAGIVLTVLVALAAVLALKAEEGVLGQMTAAGCATGSPQTLQGGLGGVNEDKAAEVVSGWRVYRELQLHRHLLGGCPVAVPLTSNASTTTFDFPPGRGNPKTIAREWLITDIAFFTTSYSLLLALVLCWLRRDSRRLGGPSAPLVDVTRRVAKWRIGRLPASLVLIAVGAACDVAENVAAWRTLDTLWSHAGKNLAACVAEASANDPKGCPLLSESDLSTGWLATFGIVKWVTLTLVVLLVVPSLVSEMVIVLRVWRRALRHVWGQLLAVVLFSALCIGPGQGEDAVRRIDGWGWLATGIALAMFAIIIALTASHVLVPRRRADPERSEPRRSDPRWWLASTLLVGLGGTVCILGWRTGFRGLYLVAGLVAAVGVLSYAIDLGQRVKDAPWVSSWLAALEVALSVAVLLSVQAGREHGWTSRYITAVGVLSVGLAGSAIYHLRHASLERRLDRFVVHAARPPLENWICRRSPHEWHSVGLGANQLNVDQRRLRKSVVSPFLRKVTEELNFAEVVKRLSAEKRSSEPTAHPDRIELFVRRSISATLRGVNRRRQVSRGVAAAVQTTLYEPELLATKESHTNLETRLLGRLNDAIVDVFRSGLDADLALYEFGAHHALTPTLWRRPSRAGAVLVSPVLGAVAIAAFGVAAIKATASDLILFGAGGHMYRLWRLIAGLGFLLIMSDVAYVGLRKMCRTRWVRERRSVVLVVCGAPFGAGLAFHWSRFNMWSAPRLGTFVVLMLFLAGLVFLPPIGMLVADSLGRRRHETIRRMAMPSLLRALGLRSTPFIGLGVCWLLTVGFVIDYRTYHDMRAHDTNTPIPYWGIDDAVDAWVARLDRLQAGSSGATRTAQPAVLVASSGGGIRAAYWTALVLDCLIEREPDDAGNPCGKAAPASRVAQRRADILMMSGISGGSLGLIEYVAAVEDGWTTPKDAPPGNWVQKRLGGDYLAPTLSTYLFDDFFNHALRPHNGFERAEALERSWEEDATGLDRNFFTEQAAGDEPLLLVNGFSVQTGCRVLTSVLRTQHDGSDAGDCTDTPPGGATADLTDDRTSSAPRADQQQLFSTIDLRQQLCNSCDINRSTAALASARFPLISPAGRLAADHPEGTKERDAVQVVDGGYHEASAASTIAELWPAFDAALAANAKLRLRTPACTNRIFIQIDNGYSGGSVTSVPAINDMSQLLAPIAGSMSGREGNEGRARQRTYALFHKLDARNNEVGYFRITTHGHPGSEAPLGWLLSGDANVDLGTQLDLNGEQIAAIRDLLDHPTCG